jgi:putative membrane protein insertion efficiency factor
MPLINKILSYLVRGYQLTLSPFFGSQCRFAPSCSEYACQCLKAHGPMKSLVNISWRILRCNPWSAGGYDPAVKETTEKSFITKISN